jgi:hypothetical protein
MLTADPRRLMWDWNWDKMLVKFYVLNGPVRQKRVSLSGAVRGSILMAVVISGIFLKDWTTALQRHMNKG